MCLPGEWTLGCPEGKVFNDGFNEAGFFRGVSLYSG